MAKRRRKRKSIIRSLAGFFMRLVLFAAIVLLGLKAAAHFGLINPEVIEETGEAIAEQTGIVLSTPVPVQRKEWDPEKEGYYYAFLNEAEQQVYQTILDACEAFEFEVSLPVPVSEDEMYHAAYAVSFDYPEYYWVNASYTYYRNADNNVISMKFESDGSEQQKLTEIEGMAEEILKDCPDTQYEAYKYLYDCIIDTTDYDESAAEGQHLTSVFFNRRSVCAGYSKAYQYLCKKAGLECIYVTGTALMKDGTYGSHAWNLIRIGEQYYWADVTWGDPLFEGDSETAKNYNYFCVSDRFFTKEHKISYLVREEEGRQPLSVDYPQCTDDSYDWYVLNGSYFETYDRTAVQQYIQRMVSEGKTQADLKFGSTDEMTAAVSDLIYGEQIFMILRDAGLFSSSLSYAAFDSVGAVRIIWY